MDTSVPELPVRDEELKGVMEEIQNGGRIEGVLLIAEDQQRALHRFQSRIEELAHAVRELQKQNRRLERKNERLRSENEAYAPLT